MEDLIEIYNDYVEICNDYIVSNKKLLNKLKKIFLKPYIKKYKTYPDLFNFFDRFELKNNIITIKDYLNNFYKVIENKIKKDKKSYDEILNEYNFDCYYPLTNFLLDLILNSDDDPESDSEEDYISNEKKYISDSENDFNFQPNQIRGIEKAIEMEIAVEIILTPAERMYSNHLKNVKTYQQKNPEKMREKCKKYNDKIKIENPEKYQEMLNKKKEYYINVKKPRIEALKAVEIV